MPIYAYKCDSCGFAKDVLQKMSDAPLTQCPSCGAPAFTKQLTAAGFQLKGSGWYATDFKDGGKKAPAATETKSESGAGATGDGKAEAKTDGKAETKSEAKTESKPEAKKAETPAPAKSDTKPAAGSGA